MTYMQLIANAPAEGVPYATVASGPAIVLCPMRVFHVALGGVFVGVAYVIGLAATRLGLPWGGWRAGGRSRQRGFGRCRGVRGVLATPEEAGVRASTYDYMGCGCLTGMPVVA